jgi:3-oxoadipate enol-lactonase
VTAHLAHSVIGDPDAPVVVLGSSLGTSGRMWDPQLAALAERFRVVTYDHRGHGDTSSPPTPYQLDDLGSDVLGLLDELGIARFSYAGLSLGGMVGMWIASETPHRVDRLALLCTSAALDAADAWHERAAAVREGGMAAVADPVVARWFTPSFAVTHPDVVAQQRAMLLAAQVEGYAGCCEAIGAMDLRDRLAQIEAPTLVIAARQDLAIPPHHSETIVKAIAGARLELIDDAAHIASVEQPAAITRLLLEHLVPSAENG